MKTIQTILTLLFVVSCNAPDDGGHTFSDIQTLNREWQSTDASMFESIDLSDPNAVSIKNASRDSVFSDCVFSSDIKWTNSYYGSLNLTLTTGDAFICSQFVGDMGFSASFSNKRQREELTIMGFVAL